MAKGTIYLMTTAVPGLIKIGKTKDFEKRMYFLEQNGYRNITSLKRNFAIEVEDYDEKEALLDTVFAKSRVGDTELFALDINLATQLLSSFEGEMIYPKTQTKDEVFDEAVDNSNSKLIPDGEYYFEQKKKEENKTTKATASIKDGKWTLKKDSILALKEGIGVSDKAKAIRLTLPLDEKGKLLEDVELGEVSPSLVGSLIVYASNNGWISWKDSNKNTLDYYRKEANKSNEKE